MTIHSRMVHIIDINNPTWSAGSKTDNWTNDVRAFIIESARILRTTKGDFVKANFLAVVGSTVTINQDAEIRYDSKVYPVIQVSKLRRSFSSQIKHIEIYA